MKYLSILTVTAVGLLVPFAAASPTFHESSLRTARRHAHILDAREPGHGPSVQSRNNSARSSQPKKRRTCKQRTSSSSAAAASSTQVSSSTEISATSTLVAIPTSSSLHTSTETSTSVETTSVETTHASTKTSTSSASVSTTTSTSTSGSGSHLFTFENKCSYSVQPKFADTSCGYSPRCPAGKYTAAQPGTLAPGATSTASVPFEWVGRVFNDIATCGPSGEDCTMLEFNLDADSVYTPNSYDISNIQGFTQSISLGADGCDTVTCTNANCGTQQAYAVGDLTGGGADYPVRACGAGNVGFKVVFCP